MVIFIETSWAVIYVINEVGYCTVFMRHGQFSVHEKCQMSLQNRSSITHNNIRKLSVFKVLQEKISSFVLLYSLNIKEVTKY